LDLHYRRASRLNQKVGRHYSAFPRKRDSTHKENQKLAEDRAGGAVSITVESAKSG
jgi:hypothetical protein